MKIANKDVMRGSLFLLWTLSVHLHLDLSVTIVFKSKFAKVVKPQDFWNTHKTAITPLYQIGLDILLATWNSEPIFSFPRQKTFSEPFEAKIVISMKANLTHLKIEAWTIPLPWRYHDLLIWFQIQPTKTKPDGAMINLRVQ